MTEQEISQRIAEYKEKYPETKYIRVVQPANFVTPVEVNSLILSSKESNQWKAIAIGGEPVGFDGNFIVEFKMW